MSERRGLARWLIVMMVLVIVQTPGCVSRSEGTPPDVLVVSQEQQPSWVRNFNPLLPNGARWPTKAGIYEPMAIFNGVSGEWVPWLASAWTWRADNLVLWVTPRRGVTWSDGAPFSGRDIVFTFNVIKREPALDTGGLWKLLRAVEVQDDGRVMLTFLKPYVPGFGDIMTLPIVPKHIWSAIDKPLLFTNPNPVGTGPFTEVNFFRDQVFELGRNPNYWQPGKPHLSAIRLPALPTNDQANMALIAGEVDWAANFVPAVERTFVRRDPEHFGYWFPLHGSTVFLYLNTARPPFDRVEVRKALSRAIDREQVVNVASYGYTEPSDVTGMSGSFDAWRDPEVVKRHDWTTFDPDQARDALATWVATEAPIELEIIVVSGWSDWVRAAQVVASQLQAIGVDAAVKTYDFNAWFERLQRGDFQGAISWSLEGATPFQFYRWLMDPRQVKPTGEVSGGNWHRFGDPEAQSLLESFEATSDQTTQRQLAKSLQRVFAERAPAIPLFPNPSWGLYNTRRIVGFPTKENPYAHLSPNHSPEYLLVLNELKPRGGP